MASLIAAVSQLKRLRETQPISVTLIDNSERSDLALTSFDILQEQLQVVEINLQLLSGHGNIGYGAGHNLLLEDLESDYHLMLNPDVVLDRECLAKGLACLIDDENKAMVSPTAHNENGKNQYLCKRYPSVLILFIRGFLPRILQRLFSSRLGHYEMHDLYSGTSSNLPPCTVPIISGCFMLCRTVALKAIKGFDESYFLYFEDFDLSLRMRSTGAVSYVPSMKILHGGGNAAKKGFKHIRIFITSGIRFFNAHGWRWF